MVVRHLSLTNFRLYARLESSLPAGPLILVGANAQGKTSLLEAIYFLATAQSHHAASDRQMIHFLALHEPQPFARLAAEVVRAGSLQRLEVRLVQEAVGSPPNRGAGGEGRLRKDISVNGVKKRVGELAGLLNVVLFLPQDMALVEGSPGDRRRYLDVALSQVEPAYHAALTEYGKILSQRNALLKALQDGGGAGDQLDFWDERLCEHGAVLLAARAAALAELEALASPLHRELTAGSEGLRLVYQPAYDPLGETPSAQLGLPLEVPLLRSGFSAAEIRTGLLARLRASRAEEIGRGMTLSGPHRDEFRLLSGGIDLGIYGSRGQARTAVLALKLAEAAWMRARTGETPLLLLDEVLAELDLSRRRDLLARLDQVEQCVLTTTDLDLFSPAFRARATIWNITAGRVSPAS